MQQLMDRYINKRENYQPEHGMHKDIPERIVPAYVYPDKKGNTEKYDAG
jgi:hypothetical protein